MASFGHEKLTVYQRSLGFIDFVTMYIAQDRNKVSVF